MNFVDVSTLHMYQSDSKVYICTTNDQAYGNIQSIIYTCFVIIAVAIILPGVIIHFFADYFTNRILSLRQAMHQVSNEDFIGTFAKEDKVEYKEGVMVGYRYYDTHNTPVNFCFGHGLSYTKFAYSDLDVRILTTKRENKICRATFTLKNIGEREGSETVQLYVKPVGSKKERPVHELKAFTKVALRPGEEKRIELTLDSRDFTYYDMERQEFVVEPCEYEIEIGASSRDIRLSKSINL